MANEMVMADSDQIQPKNFSANGFEIPRGFICTVDLSTLDGKMELAKALNGAVSMRDKVGEILRVENIVTTQGVRSRTGEACVNSYFICDDGNVYFTQSDGIARALKVLTAIFTDPVTKEFTSPISMGVGFQVTETTMDNGNTLKSVIPVKLG